MCLASTLCKYDLRKGDLFVLSWASVRRVRRGSLSSELLMCGGGVRGIFVLPLVTRCLETMNVCIWSMFVFMSVVVTVWGSVVMFVVLRQLLKIVFFSLGMLKYVVCLCREADGCCVFCLYCEAWSCRCSCMGVFRRADVVCLCLVCIRWQFSMLRSA